MTTKLSTTNPSMADPDTTKTKTTDLSVFVQGGRTGFLLIHGMSGTPVEMRYIINGLARAGYTVSCPQLPGHCGTLDQLRETGWTDWLAGVEQALAKLETQCDHVIVGGLSMGAVLALKVAARNPHIVRGSVLYAPTLWLDGWGVPLYARLFALVRQKWGADLFHFSERPPYGIKDTRLRKLIAEALASGDPSKAGFLTLPGRLLLELRWLVNSVRADLHKITQPTLIIHPREDDRASLRNPTYLARRLAGRVESVILDDSYHIITLDRQREIVLMRTEAFAKSLGAELVAAEQAAARVAMTPEAARGRMRSGERRQGGSGGQPIAAA